MAYYTKAKLLLNDLGFDGAFSEEGGELIYTTPSGVAGTVTLEVQLRYNDTVNGTDIIDSDGNVISSITGEDINVNGG